MKNDVFIVEAHGPASLFNLMPYLKSYTYPQEAWIFLQSLGSTGALITLPPIEEVKEAFVKWLVSLIPQSSSYRHPLNAYAHLRSSFMRCFSLLPFVKDSFGIYNHVFLVENTWGHKRRPISITLISQKEEGGYSLLKEEWEFGSKGWIEIIDLTEKLRVFLSKANLKDGLLLLAARDPGVSLTTIEYEGNLLADFIDFLKQLLKTGKESLEERVRAHIGAAIIGQSLFVPVSRGRLQLGTWQQVALVDMGEPGTKKLLVEAFSMKNTLG
jgi:secondary thiamine-phosphate synthase enzyme